VFSSRRRHTSCLSDWSSDVCSSDLLVAPAILDLARPEAERIFAGKRRGQHSLPQNELNLLLVRLACEGRRVVRLKGGDPYIFGRSEERRVGKGGRGDGGG